MTPPRARVVRAELAKERADLERAGREIAELLARGGESPQVEHVYALALMLHSLYNGVERIFQRIAVDLDGGLPSGPDSHVRQLETMALAVEGARPALLSEPTRDALRPYLDLRHAIRHLYFFNLRWDRLSERALALPAVLRDLSRDLDRFEEFLKALAGA